jgi:hypothetical protein
MVFTSGAEVTPALRAALVSRGIPQIALEAIPLAQA